LPPPNDYEVNWLVRTKKRQIPSRADERDRAKFAKLKNYMIRKDDLLMCKNIPLQEALSRLPAFSQSRS